MSEGYEDLEYEDYGDTYEGDLSPVEQIKPETEFKAPQFYKKGSTIFVTISDIKKLINEKCKDLNEVLGIEEDDAIILFNHFKWRRDLLDSEWLEKEDQVRRSAGLCPEEPASEPTSTEITCPLCFDIKPKNEFDHISCNHYLCKDCWKDYIEYNLSRPENLFFWKCPYQGCNIIVPGSFNIKYMRAEDKPLYDKKMGVAYADNSNSMRWCPAPGCEYGAEVESCGAKAVECPCGWMYCFKCGIEDHRPCDCSVAQEWGTKHESGGANAKWLLVNTKDCPKCKRAIEKNQGCNYMRCRHPGCQYEFCWLCLSDWKTHNDHFKCNKYDTLSKEEKGKMDSEEQNKRSELQKYVFYYERFVNNAQAIESINKMMKNLKLEEKDLSIHLSLTLTQLEFLHQACKTVRNSKRTLKWSYAYGFYLTNDLQRNLYEIIQEKMDMYSSELHVLLEKDYEEAKSNISDFTKLKDKILAAVFKCRQSAEAFLEKMEEFEATILEDEFKNAVQEDSSTKKKKRNYRKRTTNESNAEDGIEGHKKKATKKTKD